MWIKKGLKKAPLFFLCYFVVSCGPEDGKEALVRVEVANTTSLALANNVTPSYFGLKVFGVSLRKVADPTNPSAAPEYESGIYVAPTGCTNGGKSEFEKDDKLYEYYQPPGPHTCTAADMAYVDFARDAAVVNEELAAGNYPVIPGVYNQATICWMSLHSLAVTGHIESPVEVDIASATNSKAGCVDTILENFVVNEGETATVRLDYDLSDGAVAWTDSIATYADGSGTGCVESETESGRYFCINGLTVTPIGVK